MKRSYIIIALLLAACGTKVGKNETTNLPSTTITNNNSETQVAPTERAIFHASETILTNLIHTKLDVKVDWAKAYLYGKATITAKPHFYPSDSLILDAKGMQINTVTINGKELSFTYKEDYLKIKLDKTYTRKEQYTVLIDYVAKPNERESGGSAAITSDKGLYFINHDGSDPNRMPQIWTQGETEASSVWFPTIDSPNAKTTQEIFITVEDKFVTLSNGKFVGSKKNSDGTRTDHWKQDLPHAPYLFMMGIGEFKIVKDSYTRNDGKTMEVNYYVEPEWEQYAKAIFGNTPEMIRFFSDKLGVQYPWDKYHQIVVRDYVSGAMENTGAVVFGDFVYSTDRDLLDANHESIIAHELFHHWFGDLVTAESWSNLPLNEAFANYSQYLWDEYKYGKDEADFNASSEANGYIQQGQMSGYHDLIWYDYDEKEQMFDGHSYNKGGRILHMLRNYVGDEAFFLSLNKYLTDNQYKAAEYHHLRLAFEEVTGEDLNWFFMQWFTASGHPELSISQKIEGNELVVTIKQTQNLLEFPIFKIHTDFAVTDESGTKIHKIVIDKIENTFRFPLVGALKTYEYDTQGALLAVVKDDKTQEHYIQQYNKNAAWKTRYSAVKNGMKRTDEASSKMILEALNDPFWNVRVLAIDKASKLKDANKEAAITKITALAKDDNSSAVRVAAINYLEKITAANRETIYVNALKDSSYNVVSTALRNLNKVNSSLAIQKAKELENETASKMVMGVAGLYAESKDPAHYNYFKKNLTGGKLSGFEEVGVMNIFSTYMIAQAPSLILQSTEVYKHISKSGGMYAKMFFDQNISFLIQNINARLTSEKSQLKDFESAKDNINITKTEKNIKDLEESITILTGLNSK